MRVTSGETSGNAHRALSDASLDLNSGTGPIAVAAP